jgi:neutral ceramidase
MADEHQKTTGVECPLFARAFIISEIPEPGAAVGRRVCLVNADLWSCTLAVKREVVLRLQSRPELACYVDENVMISGTHNHSGPGGFSHYYLYNHSIGGFDPHNFECIVSGIVSAIDRAHSNLAPGGIMVQMGVVPDCGRQRSAQAYVGNDLEERERYDTDTDREMLLLKFVQEVAGDENGEGSSSPQFQPIGALSFFAVHPTDRGQSNTLVCGDSKGFASSLFEGRMGTDVSARNSGFVAAFANSNAGDVSGNVEFAQRPDGRSDKEHMEIHGRRQFNTAWELFSAASHQLHGPVDCRHRYIDMTVATGCHGALGLSMFAGSTEDSVAGSGLQEGLLEGETKVTERMLQRVLGPGFRWMSRTPCPTGNDLDPEERARHQPKSIALVPGLASPPLTPSVLPVQLLRIGEVAIVGVPCELTTMSGRRMREAMLRALEPLGVRFVALGTYANGYSQYVVTREEYNKQHYEGGSTLFGPSTLETYTQAVIQLGEAMVEGRAVPQGPDPLYLSGDDLIQVRRVTVRNLTSRPKRLTFFRHDDRLMVVPIRTGVGLIVEPGGDAAFHPPGDGMVKCAVADVDVEYDPDVVYVESIAVGNLVTLATGYEPLVSDYRPPARTPDLSSAQLAFMFRAYDANGDGRIDRGELKDLIKAAAVARRNPVALDPEALAAVTEVTFQAVDRDNNDWIDFDEFRAAVLDHTLPICDIVTVLLREQKQ